MSAPLTGQAAIGSRFERLVWQTNELAVFYPSLVAAVKLANQYALQFLQRFDVVGRIGQIVQLLWIFFEIK